MKTWLAINKDLYNIPQLAATVCSDIQFFLFYAVLIPIKSKATCCVDTRGLHGGLGQAGLLIH